ncbi:response regulator transcription factor [Streptomyces sp. NPDC092952]|uniref:helix-turn-helix transcriptional regulator n=1 Tax=Streptomyces sp. NPDC092952 TaxID=3366018 RepID=UPI0037F63717
MPEEIPSEPSIHHTVRPNISGRGTATPSERTAVTLLSRDPLSLSGIEAILRPRPEITLLHEAELQQAQVAIVVAHGIDDDVLVTLRRIHRLNGPFIALVAEGVTGIQLSKVTECGAIGLMLRSEVTPENVVTTVKTVAHGGGHIPSDLLGKFLTQVGTLQRQVLRPGGIPFNSLTEREIQVLRLCAEGHSTAEIADELNFSERTIKNTLHALLERFQWRNRPQAVASAIRMGLF